MKKLVVGIAVSLGVSVFGLGGAAFANQSGGAINCVTGKNPGQTFQALNAAGPNGTTTPPKFAAAALGGRTVGEALQDFCTTPADTP
jgi:hypothetical protein